MTLSDDRWQFLALWAALGSIGFRIHDPFLEIMGGLMIVLNAVLLWIDYLKKKAVQP